MITLCQPQKIIIKYPSVNKVELLLIQYITYITKFYMNLEITSPNYIITKQSLPQDLGGPMQI